jgi:hypothetical protein
MRSADQAQRELVASVVAHESSRLRRGSAATVLAVLSAAALAPVAVAVAGGNPVMAALAGVAGNIGAGHVTDMIQRAAARLRGEGGERSPLGAAREALTSALEDALETGDDRSEQLTVELTALVARADGFTAAIEAASTDLRSHLLRCFAELDQQQDAVLDRLRRIDLRQERQTAQQQRLIDVVEETRDRMRWLMRTRREHAADDEPAIALSQRVRDAPAAVMPVVAASAGPTARWQAGAEVSIGNRVFLLQGDHLEEEFSDDHAVMRRQARSLRIVPSTGPNGHRYAWLRQVETRGAVPVARAAADALVRERDLLIGLEAVRGLPQVDDLVSDGRTTTLVLAWPTASSTGIACDTLAAVNGIGGEGTAGPGPIDRWRLSRLWVGMAALCDGLASLHAHGYAHRQLHPGSLVVSDGGRLVVRDLGLAACPFRPGEGPAGNRAPEQRHGGEHRPGPWTDVYQLAAVTYRLVTGHPPPPTHPLPIQTQVAAGRIPSVLADAVDAALSPRPSDRPQARQLGSGFRAASRHVD